MEIAELCRSVGNLVQEKGWNERSSQKPQNPKNIAISLALEAAELLEHFQWNDHANASDLGDELADILIYAAQFANVSNINLENAVQRKLEVNRVRSWAAAGSERR